MKSIHGRERTRVQDFYVKLFFNKDVNYVIKKWVSVSAYLQAPHHSRAEWENAGLWKQADLDLKSDYDSH